MSSTRITAKLSSIESLTAAKHAALNEHKSLQDWAGQVIEAALKKQEKKQRK